ncbi:E3 ubiquitin-protein ligase TRIM35-like [Corythoichthys intestinalis]|uniref:E3 ubiquitin-protein ligase TRIM35-like n=1 Tax=Corythoichthys intestinalis TaxID=161448 RepID=UPI0025A52666|nr:E3 ubiquitin-protein ligase TRIM35-like [Corythoichthys intestinalis]
MAERLEEHLQCPTCLDIFKDPVILPCSHNFCRACLQQWKDAGERSCPVCWTKFGSMELPSNLTLKNLCEDLSRASVKSEDLCSLHEGKLQLFCLDHQELVCLVCRDAEIHIGHTFQPLDEVVKGHHEELQRGLQKAKERLQDYNDCRENFNEQAEYIKVQRENVEGKIKKDFEELRRFLDVEEEARLAAVREEKKKKSQTMKEKMVALDRQMAALSNFIRSTEEQLASGNVSFMKKFKTAMSGIQELPEKPHLLPGGLLDEAKHVGNLKFKVWERMKETLAYSPVILDPNTAYPNISLSEDLSSLSLEDKQKKRLNHPETAYRKISPSEDLSSPRREDRHQKPPNNPERFQKRMSNCVLGAALDSGRHVWDVEVGDNNGWSVGVAWGDPCLPEEMNTLLIEFRDGKYKKPGGKNREWNPLVKVQRIRVEVDMKERAVSFSEPLANTKLWSNKCPEEDWQDLSCNIKMYPYFFTKSTISLEIIRIPPVVTTAIR